MKREKVDENKYIKYNDKFVTVELKGIILCGYFKIKDNKITIHEGHGFTWKINKEDILSIKIIKGD